jgi:hypothetical protein
MKEVKKKKGLFEFIKESMNKTGGCCGPGESCCGPAPDEKEEKEENKNAKGKKPDGDRNE